MNELDLRLKNRYERAYNIIGNLPVGDKIVPLIIEVANQIKLAEEKHHKETNKTDFGTISDVDTEKRKETEARKEADEEEAWGELDLGIPKGGMPKPPEE